MIPKNGGKAQELAQTIFYDHWRNCRRASPARVSLSTMIILTCCSDSCWLSHLTNQSIEKCQSWEDPRWARRATLIYFADEKVEVGREETCLRSHRKLGAALRLESRSPGAGAGTPPAHRLLSNIRRICVMYPWQSQDMSFPASSPFQTCPEEPSAAPQLRLIFGRWNFLYLCCPKDFLELMALEICIN